MEAMTSISPFVTYIAYVMFLQPWSSDAHMTMPYITGMPAGPIGGPGIGPGMGIGPAWGLLASQVNKQLFSIWRLIGNIHAMVLTQLLTSMPCVFMVFISLQGCHIELLRFQF